MRVSRDREQPHAEMENAAVVSSGAPDGIRVLAVEEDPSDLAALTQILQLRGYQGKPVRSGHLPPAMQFCSPPIPYACTCGVQ